MTGASYIPVIWLLAVLSIFVTILLDLFKKRQVEKDDLIQATIEDRTQAFSQRAVLIGIVLAFLVRANIFEILKNPETPALFLGWRNAEFSWWGLEQILGCAVTGCLLAFLSRFWNEFFKILSGLKYLIRSKSGVGSLR
ncbi:MAG: hypothetical protein HOM68_22140 [Gemmatimonadetes bacterium]|jgi:preprotein translocase subunit SecY|nr:hypothetical protein [Gemmatimonadota bacterium]MBT5059259.1 hypothetical protein [Gemmatimonadota bacterium]MBT5145509.1 hypothetical protein [Gemmatimonadota bacterium]MBT5591697.1 hypothetical protein [Gemmatimonadota bacterium]MBT5961848.1 hypothetical protein [Gemmatimonadota bacterium]